MLLCKIRTHLNYKKGEIIIMNRKKIIIIIVIVIVISIFIKFLTIKPIYQTNQVIKNPFSYSSPIYSNWNIKMPNPLKRNVILSQVGTNDGISRLEFSNTDYEKFKNSIDWINPGNQSEYYINDFIKFISSKTMNQKQSDKDECILFLENLKKDNNYKFFYKINTKGYLYFILVKNKPNIIYSITIGSR